MDIPFFNIGANASINHKPVGNRQQRRKDAAWEKTREQRQRKQDALYRQGIEKAERAQARKRKVQQKMLRARKRKEKESAQLLGIANVKRGR